MTLEFPPGRRQSDWRSAHLMTSMGLLYDKAGRIERDVRLSEGGDDAFAAPLRRAEVDEENLILLVVDDSVQFGLHRMRSEAVNWHSNTEYCRWSP